MPETLEAEVIEIDGQPPPRSESLPDRRGFGSRATWVWRFDRRWWPLWVVLGGVLLVVGVIGGALYLVVAMIRTVLRLLFGGPARR